MDYPWGISENIHTPMMEGMLENLKGGGVNDSGNSDGKVGSTLCCRIVFLF